MSALCVGVRKKDNTGRADYPPPPPQKVLIPPPPAPDLAILVPQGGGVHRGVPLFWNGGGRFSPFAGVRLKRGFYQPFLGGPETAVRYQCDLCFTTTLYDG